MADRCAAAVLGVIALFALGPASLAAQDTPTRTGFWMNLGLGYGSLGQDEFNGRQGGEALQLVFGGAVNERLLIGASINGWTRLENGIKLEVGLVAATARYYPSETGGFFVAGGLGVGTIHEDVSFSGPGHETGLGALLGLGYDLRLGAGVSLTPFVNGLFVGNSDADVTVVQAGLASPFTRGGSVELGAFSVSLAVKDLEASKSFYERLGFEVFGGEASQNWLIMKNGDHAIGLFHGMFEQNIMTFNPGWDSNATTLESFTDIRDIQRRLKAAGIELMSEADETTTGPASLFVVDPDGNQILIDQHV